MRTEPNHFVNRLGAILLFYFDAWFSYLLLAQGICQPFRIQLLVSLRAIDQPVILNHQYTFLSKLVLI